MNRQIINSHSAANQNVSQRLKFFSAPVGILWLGLFVVSVASYSGADVGDGQLEQKEALKFDLKGRTIVLHNLAGSVKIVPATDNQVSIEATIVAGGNDAASHLKLIELEPVENKQRIEIFTHYPVRDYSRYYYQSTKGYGSSNTQLKYEKRKVSVSNKQVRNALDLHVDYIVRLPASSHFVLTNAVGDITAQNVTADLNLDSHSGAIAVAQVRGDARLDTGSGQLSASDHTGDVNLDSGSGRVSVKNVEGRVDADTGSGSIKIDSVSGDVNLDTGSGSVKAANIGGELSVDTGSGSVEIEGTRNGVDVDTGSGSVKIKDLAGSAVVDTGSGSIDIERWQGGERLDLDTGSGSIDVSGDFSIVRKLRIDTGSGSVELITSTVPSLRLDIESSSGINVDLPDMSRVQSSRTRFRATVGSGDGDGNISTGSGGVKFTYQ